MAETANVDTAPRPLYTVAQFSERHPAFSQPSLRNMILHAEDRQNSRGERVAGNRLLEAGAIVRIGRRVLIDEKNWYHWIANQQRTARRDAKALT
jgi:hypothetical protein